MELFGTIFMGSEVWEGQQFPIVATYRNNKYHAEQNNDAM